MAERRKAELPFVMLPMIMLCGCFNSKEIATYACLLRHCDRDTFECFPSRKTIAFETGMSVQSVDAALKSLRRKEMIDVIPRFEPSGRRTSNLYKVADQIHVVDEVC